MQGENSFSTTLCVLFMEITLTDDPQSSPKLPIDDMGSSCCSDTVFQRVFLFFFLLLFLVVFTLGGNVSAANDDANDNIGTEISLDNPNATSTNPTPANAASSTRRTTTVLRSVEDLKQLSKKRCARYYTLECLKVDMISFVDRMGRNTKMDVIYGITIVSDSDKYKSSSERALGAKNLELFTSNSDSSQLDELLLQKVNDYVKSLTLNVHLFGAQESTAKSLGENLLDSIIGSFEGRAAKKTNPVGGKLSGVLTSAALVTAGALLWVGLSTIAAVATKALVTALVSLVITCFTAYKTSGSNTHKSTTYEIVARPMYTHGHTAAAEIQHDPHSVASSNGIGYGRNMEWDKSSNVLQIPARVEDPLVVHDLVYRAHVRPIYKRGTPILRS